MSATNSNN